MPNPCDLVEQTLELSDDVALTVGTQTADPAFTLGAETAHKIKTVLSNGFTLNDEVDDRVSIQIVETFTLNDAVSVSGTLVTDVVEDLRLSSQVRCAIVTEHSDTFTLDDAVQAAVQSSTAEAFTLNDAVEISGTFDDEVADSLTLDDATRVQVRAEVSESFTLDDAVQIKSSIVNLVSDTFTLDDAVQVSSIISDEVEDRFTLDDAVAFARTTSSESAETIYFSDHAQGGGRGSAWRAHLEPFAMSRYTEYGFNSFAVIDGRLWGASADGLFLLSGTTDAGRNIDAEVAHDWTDRQPGRRGTVASDKLKRPRYVYLDHMGGDLAFVLNYVTTDGDEDEAEVSISARSEAQFVNTREKLGRGIRSRRMQPVIRNEGGSDFAIRAGRVVVDNLERSL